MITVLLLEDDVALANELNQSLTSESFKVFLAASVAEAKQVLAAQKIQLAIVDLNLPDGSGFDVLPWIKETPAVVITALNTPENRLKAIELGSYDFISKPFFFKELLLKIKQLLKITYENKKITLSNSVNIDLDTREINNSSGTVFMSEREFKLLKLLIDKAPQVVTRDEVLDVICDKNEFPTERIVDNSILKLRTMLDDKNHEVIRSVRGVGYQWLKAKGAYSG